MESFPLFDNPTIFPPFSTIPLANPESTNPSPNSDSNLPTFAPIYYLIGTISENMTLGTNPTFICVDRNMVPFAVTIKLRSGTSDGQFDIKTCKKGHTMAIRGAEKFGVKEGKQGFIETSPRKIKILPASVEKLISMSAMEERRRSQRDESKDLEACQGCLTEKAVETLFRCTGCESVWYCDKSCQTKGWTDKGHKHYCKILRGVKVLAEE